LVLFFCRHQQGRCITANLALYKAQKDIKRARKKEGIVIIIHMSKKNGEEGKEKGPKNITADIPSYALSSPPHHQPFSRIP
jgi:hypothetical protein